MQLGLRGQFRQYRNEEKQNQPYRLQFFRQKGEAKYPKPSKSFTDNEPYNTSATVGTKCEISYHFVITKSPCLDIHKYHFQQWNVSAQYQESKGYFRKRRNIFSWGSGCQFQFYKEGMEFHVGQWIFPCEHKNLFHEKVITYYFMEIKMQEPTNHPQKASRNCQPPHAKNVFSCLIDGY